MNLKTLGILLCSIGLLQSCTSKTADNTQTTDSVTVNTIEKVAYGALPDGSTGEGGGRHSGWPAADRAGA